MNKKINFKLIELIIIIIGIAFVVGNSFPRNNQRPAVNREIYESMRLFSEVLTKIQKYYVEEVKPKEIIYGAIKGMLKTLDPYSEFLDPDAYKELEIETTGEFGGIGIHITMKDNWLTVVSPMEGTPAFKAGIKANDRIVEIDGKSTEGITLNEAVKKLRGPKGTVVELKISRQGEKELLKFTLVRDIITIKSVRTKMLPNNIGYVRVSAFQEKTLEDLQSGLKELAEQGLKAIILDLRYNHGGTLKAGVEVADLFLPPNKLIVSTEGREKEQNREYKSTEKAVAYTNYPMVVLVNKETASAAEIVAGALQDYKRAVILGPKGTKTFGKGSVQSVMELSDGSALRLTTAKYFTPLHRSIHNEGITPDIEVEVPEEVENAVLAKGLLGDLQIPKVKKEKDGSFTPIENETVEDVQLISAINILKASEYFRSL